MDGIGEVIPPGWTRVELEDVVTGDVGVMRDGQHVAAYLGDGWWISATRKVGVYRFADHHRVKIDSVWRWVA